MYLITGSGSSTTGFHFRETLFAVTPESWTSRGAGGRAEKLHKKKDGTFDLDSRGRLYVAELRDSDTREVLRRVHGGQGEDVPAEGSRLRVANCA